MLWRGPVGPGDNANGLRSPVYLRDSAGDLRGGLFALGAVSPAASGTPTLTGSFALGTDGSLWICDGTAWFPAGQPSTLAAVVAVTVLTDLPEASGGVITLAADTTYLILGDVDLGGARLVASAGTTIQGTSMFTSKLRSTGLVGSPLLTVSRSTTLQNITFTADVAVSCVTAVPYQTMIWSKVQFLGCGAVGAVSGFFHVLVELCAFLGSPGLTFDGILNTVVITGSMLNSGSVTPALVVAPTAVVASFLWLLESAVVAEPGEAGIEVNAAAFTNPDSFRASLVSFSGGGTYVTGAGAEDDFALFQSCIGIENSAISASYYMTANATPTPSAGAGVFVKVLGTTVARSPVGNYTLADNRVTYTGLVQQFFMVTAVVTLSGSANHQITGRFAKGGVTLAAYETRVTMNSAGRVSAMTIQAVVELAQGEYVEVWATDNSGAVAFTAEDMNVIIRPIS